MSTITRNELYALVWSAPVQEVSLQLGISDVYLGFVCTALDVPRPSRGYWRRRETGNAGPVPELPAAGSGTRQSWTKGDAIGFARRRKPKKLKFSAPEKERPTTPATKKKDGLHELVRTTEDDFRTAQPGSDGFYLKPRRKLLVDIATSAAGLDGCLRFASLLFNTLEEAGHPVEIADGSEILIRVDIDNYDESVKPDPARPDSPLPWAPRRPTVVHIEGVPLGLALVEVSENQYLAYAGDGNFVPVTKFNKAEFVGYTWKTFRRRPSGRLKLTAYSPFHDVPWRHQWIETRNSPLDARLKEIVAVLNAGAIDLALRLEKAGRFFK
ncbi:hypothetical protein ELH94_14915 [Rhizobium leguminosarum]|uniref:hypothetical protein n=1 Tax=Rhizobium leguminosarum TaxID=384 RepID=UPI0010319CD6|nr:hypothetical protein [Rhizobium leguminosarum]TAX97716.1 hypothetical protein ELH94_14915 [Rhizobium leguminosarum]